MVFMIVLTLMPASQGYRFYIKNVCFSLNAIIEVEQSNKLVYLLPQNFTTLRNYTPLPVLSSPHKICRILEVKPIKKANISTFLNNGYY